MACRLIESGHGAVVLDPKGDQMLRGELLAAAARRGAAFLEWTPEGPLAYNPYATGSETEIAEKALGGERFTEPHYLRQAQRYLGHAVRSMHAAGVEVTPVSLMAQLDPRELEVIAREIPEEQAQEVQRYLDSLTERQRRDLAGVRDRLSILAESDVRDWVDPGRGRPELQTRCTHASHGDVEVPDETSCVATPKSRARLHGLDPGRGVLGRVSIGCLRRRNLLVRQPRS